VDGASLPPLAIVGQVAALAQLGQYVEGIAAGMAMDQQPPVRAVGDRQRRRAVLVDDAAQRESPVRRPPAQRLGDGRGVARVMGHDPPFDE